MNRRSLLKSLAGAVIVAALPALPRFGREEDDLALEGPEDYVTDWYEPSYTYWPPNGDWMLEKRISGTEDGKFVVYDILRRTPGTD